MGILISLAFSLVLSMAGDPFRVLTPGDPVGAGEGPFNAQWHNMATEAIRVSQRATPPGMTPREVVKERDTAIWLANVSEKEINEFRPVGLGNLAIYPANDGDFRERLCFLSDKLDGGRPFGIVQEPIGAGKLYACKVSAGPGGQPPNKNWLRLVGEPELWNLAETYALGEPVNYIGPASPWTDGQGYVIGDLAEADGVVFRCVVVHVAEPGNGPPSEAFWEISKGKDYVALVKHSGRVPPTNPTYWLLIGPHRGIWNRGDTYATGDVVVDPQLGRIIVDGVSRARITVTQAGHQYVVMDDGILTTAKAGPTEILWRQGGLGDQWAVVRLCCDNGLEAPAYNGDGQGLLPLFECAGEGTFIFRPGGALVVGAMVCDGAGMHSYPARLGNGTLTLGAMLSDSYGAVYDPPPSGRLNLGTMACAGSGTRTRPPIGSGTPSMIELRIAGLGVIAAPACIGSGSLSLAAIGIASSGGGYTNTAMFVAKMTNPLFDAPTARWVYDWVEQTINPASGDYQDLAGGKSGTTSAGPIMRERNNTLVGIPIFSLARLRGAWNGQPLYDFEHCCSKGAAPAGASLTLAAMICEGSGTTEPPPIVGAGNLATSAMACEGIGYESADSVHVGTGSPQFGTMVGAGIGLVSGYSVNVGMGKPLFGAIACVASGLVESPVFAGAGNFQAASMTCEGIGLSNAYSVSVGKGVPQGAAMTCAGSGTVLAPVYLAEAVLQCGSMNCAGTGLSSAESIYLGTSYLQTATLVGAGGGLFSPIRVGAGNLQLGTMLCVGSGEAWIDTQESSEGGIAAGGNHQTLVDLGTDGGVAAGGSHQVLSDLGTQGGVAAGGSHQALSDLGTDGGVAAGGSHQVLSDLGTDGGVAAGGTHDVGGGNA